MGSGCNNDPDQRAGKPPFGSKQDHARIKNEESRLIERKNEVMLKVISEDILELERQIEPPESEQNFHLQTNEEMLQKSSSTRRHPIGEKEMFKISVSNAFLALL